MKQRFANNLRQFIASVESDSLSEHMHLGSLQPLLSAVIGMHSRYESLLREANKALVEKPVHQSDLEKLRGEHHYASEIQRSMLPQIDNPFLPRHQIDLFADLDTAWEIGGDFYDFFEINSEHICFNIGDVSGKGVAAALFNMVVKTVIKMRAMDGVPLQTLCEEASKQLYRSQNAQSHMFVTLWIGILNTQTGRLDYVNAGHEPPILLGDNKEAAKLLPSVSGLPIAAYYNPLKPEKNQYTPYTLQLDKGDALLLYTDGATEVRNKAGEAFGKERLISAAANYMHGETVPEHSMKGLVEYMQRNVIKHGNHAQRDDDIALLGIQRL